MTRALQILHVLITPGALAADAPDPASLGCAGYVDAGVAPGEDFKRLALLVGVAEYAAEHVPDLTGPPNDVALMYQLLTDPEGGYGFPPENICVLLNQDATAAAFRDAWDRLTRATQGGDTVFFYYAGHGSQTSDRNGDEADGMDETMMLHDARTPGVFDVVDDDFNQMVRELHARKPQQLVIGLDSCNSGSAARDIASASAASTEPGVEPITRMFTHEAPEAYGVTPSTASTTEMPLDALPGVVVLSAAKDGSGALEIDGHGVFTQALVESLAGVAGEPLTWSQIGRQVLTLVRAQSRRQVPVIQGSLESYVFNNVARSRPLSAEVVVAPSSKEKIKLAGTAMPGWGVGALARIYPGSASAADADDPRKAKAIVLVNQYDQLTAIASLMRGSLSEIQAGDLAVLIKRSPDAQRLLVRIDDSVPPATRATFEAALEERKDIAQMVALTAGIGAFSVERPAAGGLRIRDPDGVARATVDQPYDAVENLGLHARQSALLGLSGEGGSAFVNDGSLVIWLTPHEDQLFSCTSAPWVQACPGDEQVIPLCTRWTVNVHNTSEKNMLVGGAMLLSDGSILALPEAGREVRLSPGQRDSLYNLELIAVPPVARVEHIVVSGTTQQDRIDWQSLASPAASRAAKGSVPTNPWTTSHLDFRVEANAHLEQPARSWDGSACVERSVEAPGVERSVAASELYLEAYLPAGADAPLTQVLRRAHDQALRSKGAIDGAAEIARIFAASSVPLVEGGDLSALEMADPEGPLSSTFEDCRGDVPATGDLLVYAGIDASGQPAGYVEMLLDPRRAVAWGAAGYGAAGELGLSGASREACWRHPEFIGADARGGEITLPMCWNRDAACCAIPENCDGW